MATERSVFLMPQNAHNGLNETDSETEDELEQTYWKPSNKSDNITNIVDQQIKTLKLKEREQKKKEKEKEHRKRFEQNNHTVRSGGSFQIQCHIIECRDLKSKNLPDTKKSTRVIEKDRNPKLDEILKLYFDFDFNLLDTKKSTRVIENNEKDINPVVRVNLLDTKKSTRVIEKDRNPKFDEILYFDFDLQPN
eukprot:1111982_1